MQGNFRWATSSNDEPLILSLSNTTTTYISYNSSSLALTALLQQLSSATSHHSMQYYLTIVLLIPKAGFPATITDPIILHFFAVLCSVSYEDNPPDILLCCQACHFTTIIISRCSNGKVVRYNNIFLRHNNDYIFYYCICLLFCFSRRCIPSHVQLQGLVKNMRLLITDLGV